MVRAVWRRIRDALGARGRAPHTPKREEIAMKEVIGYDGNLEMFRETPRAISMAHLRFLRWLVEQGRLEHLPYGLPCGEFAAGDVAGEGSTTWYLEAA
jgi:hypothetical protein